MSQLSSSISLPQLAYKGIPVVTTETLARAYEVKPINIQKNFSVNKYRFVEGRHYYTVSGNDLRELKHRLTESKSVKIARNVNALTLWTERGAARHAKMLNSDKAWDMFELLEETFFRVAAKGGHQADIADTSVLSSIESRKPLRALVGTWAQASGQTFAACWNQLKAAFQLANIKDLPEAWVPDAIAWVQNRLDAVPKALPEPEPQDGYADCLVKLDDLCDRVRTECHPGAKTTFMTEPEREMYALRYEMYCAVTDCLLAAHRMMNVGRRLDMKRSLIG